MPACINEWTDLVGISIFQEKIDRRFNISIHCPLSVSLLSTFFFFWFEGISENLACRVCMSGLGVMIFLVLVSHTISTTNNTLDCMVSFCELKKQLL
jgi:hypothetical protein